MKNIQVIDSAENCEFSVFAATEEVFALLFPSGTDVAFADEAFARLDEPTAERVASTLWSRPIRFEEVKGIHGTLFYLFPEKVGHFPSRMMSDLPKSSGYPLDDASPVTARHAET